MCKAPLHPSCRPLQALAAALRSPRSLLQAEQPQLPQPVLVGEVLQPSDHLRGLLWPRSNTSTSAILKQPFCSDFPPASPSGCPRPRAHCGLGSFPLLSHRVHPCPRQSPKNTCGCLGSLPCDAPNRAVPLPRALRRSAGLLHQRGAGRPMESCQARGSAGERGFCPGAGVGPRNHLIGPGMLSSSRGGAAGWVSLFSSRAATRWSGSWCSRSRPVSLLPTPSRFTPRCRSAQMAAATPHILSARRKALGWGNATGRAPCPVGSWPARRPRGEYCCSLSNLGSSRR